LWATPGVRFELLPSTSFPFVPFLFSSAMEAILEFSSLQLVVVGWEA
jgi:hypothetical protein